MNSLRIRLLIIVECAILPMMALICYNDITYRHEAILAKQKELQELIRNCDVDYRHTIDQTKQLLVILAHFPAVRHHDAKPCSEIFAKIIKENPLYLNVMAARPDGEIFASGISINRSAMGSLADRVYFQRILQTKDFSMGELVLGHHATGIATLPCGYPALHSSGQIQAVVAAGLNLAHLSNIFQLSGLPADVSLTIINSQGSLMFRRLDHGKMNGQDLSQVEIVKTVLAQKQGLATAAGIDGMERLYAFMPLGASQQEFIYAGFPTASIYTVPDRIFIRNLLLLAAITLLTILMAGFLGYRFIMRGLTIMTATAQSLAQGDLAARTGLPQGKGEIGDLARAFDVMANNLQQRDAQLLHAQKEWERTFDTVPDPIAILDREFRFVRVNKAMASRLGITPQEAVGLKCYEVIDKAAAPPDFCPYAQLLQDQREHFLEVRQENLGGDFIVSVSPVFDMQGVLAGGVLVARDISQRKKAWREREKLIDELKEALAQVKTLRGFIPICANCKKIRDDEGFWNCVEKYLSEHSEVKFSHGICPDCAKNLYPEFIKKKQDNDN
jgi:PAS domain S-box-containing protein